MSLSGHEQRVLTEIEQGLTGSDPALVASLRRGRPRLRPAARLPGWTGRLWVLVLVLAVLALHPLVVTLSVVGVGLLTATLVLPWLLHASAAARRGRPGRPG